MPLLQYRLYHILEPIQLLHTLHHHGVSLLQHIQGKNPPSRSFRMQGEREFVLERN